MAFRPNGFVPGGLSLSGTSVPENTRKERLSIAYIQAVAARAGFDLVEPRIDIDSVDVMLKSTTGMRPQIEVQAKATSIDVLSDDSVKFQLPRKNYDDLRADTITPRILVVFVMPENSDEWLGQSENELTLRKCAYWLSLHGYPSSSNSSTITVSLPRTQIFDERQLIGLMLTAEKGPIL